MKKIINILMIIILTLLALNCNCYAFDFEFNSNIYSINKDIPSFPTTSSSIGDIYKYLVIYNCDESCLILIGIASNDNDILVKRSNENLRFLNTNGFVSFFKFDLSLNDNIWEEYDAGSIYRGFPSSLGQQVFIFKSEGVTIDSSVYDISGDGSVTLDFILKDTEITENGYKYEIIEGPIKEDITLKDIYNSLNILVFIVTVLFVYIFIKSILRVRG